MRNKKFRKCDILTKFACENVVKTMELLRRQIGFSCTKQ